MLLEQGAGMWRSMGVVTRAEDKKTACIPIEFVYLGVGSLLSKN